MLRFKNLILHNFGSYAHTEIDLQNRGFCLVSGQNNCPQDNALSNGSGKSFLWSAICFALTGETVNGNKTNLKNINIKEDSCYVSIEFFNDKDYFILTRVVSPKSDLKIIKNDIDISGKGLRESEKKLIDLLPDLTRDLITSTIIIGQGMPNKFSSFSPSGRKELLEKLTKSDFMIDDLKTRVSARLQELQTKIRELEDSLLANKTQSTLHSHNLNRLQEQLYNTTKPDFEHLIGEQEQRCQQFSNDLIKINADLEKLTEQTEITTQKLLKVTTEKAEMCAADTKLFNEAMAQLNSNKITLELKIKEIEREIKRLKSISDVCPTCKQKIPHIIKPDTSEQEVMLVDLQNKLSEVATQISDYTKQHLTYTQSIEIIYADQLEALNSEQQKLKSEVITLTKTKESTMLQYSQAQAAVEQLLKDRQSWDSRIASYQKEIENLALTVAQLDNVMRLSQTAKDEFQVRLGLVKKMDNLIRRDFRGILLENIITYLNYKAKDFCNIVFNTRELDLTINGNALDITYCGKVFDSLSGGEQQRVDLILQLAIRDMLNNYLKQSANILVLDEVTDFLDKKSCQAVMNLLETELSTIESVFIISHHAEELDLPIDSEIKITKNEMGISEVG